MKKKIIAFILVISCLAMIATGCKAEGAPTGRTIVVAVVAPLSGNLEQEGKNMVAGATLAAEELNKKGGLLGYKIEIQEHDSQNDPTLATEIANQLIEDTNVFTVVGDYSTEASVAGAGIYAKGELVQISPNVTESRWLDASVYQFTAGAQQPDNVVDLGGAVVADYLKLEEVSVIDIINPIDSMYRLPEFMDGLYSAGVSPTGVTTMSSEETDFSRFTSTLKDTEADAVAIMAEKSSAEALAGLIRAIREVNPELPIVITPNMLTEEPIKNLKDISKVYSAKNIDKKESDLAKKISNKITKQTEFPDSGVGFASYQAVMMLGEASAHMEEVTRDNIRIALEEAYPSYGLTEPGEESGEASQKIVELKNGKWK